MFVQAVILLGAAVSCLAGPYRPCPDLDLACIRQYMQANSYCNPQVQGGIPEAYTIDTFVVETPYFNATQVDHSLVSRNHQYCVFTEFLLDEVTDKAVIAMDCPNFELESDRQWVQHVPRSEDVIYSFHIKSTYPLLRFTMNIPNIRNLDICVPKAYPEVTAPPTVHINYQAEPTENFVTRDFSNRHIYEVENIADRSKGILRYTINSLICNFGCDF